MKLDLEHLQGRSRFIPATIRRVYRYIEGIAIQLIVGVGATMRPARTLLWKRPQWPLIPANNTNILTRTAFQRLNRPGDVIALVM
jgi:hypothetical protein